MTQELRHKREIKLKALILDHGLEAYGFYFYLLYKSRNEDGFCFEYTIEQITELADGCRLSTKKSGEPHC